MSRKRTCFASSVCCSDAFAELPAGSQALYLQLGFCADVDGAINGIKKELRASGFSGEALDALFRAGFLVEADGVPFIAHWWVNNRKNNRDYRPGDHAELIGTALELGEDGVYRMYTGHTTDERCTSNVNIIKSKVTQSNATQSNATQTNEIEAKEKEGKAPAPTAQCPTCGEACTAYEDPLGGLVSHCSYHGGFTITADGEVLQ